MSLPILTPTSAKIPQILPATQFAIGVAILDLSDAIREHGKEQR